MKNCCQTNTTRQHKCFRCQSRLNVVTRMLSSSLLLSHAVGRILNFISHFFIREPPQFKWSAVRHSYPFVVLVTIFLRKGDETYYSMLSNFSIKSSTKNVSKYANQTLFNVLSKKTLSMLIGHITCNDKKYYLNWQELEDALERNMKCTHKEFQIFYQPVSSILAKRYTKSVMKITIKVIITMIVN